MGGQVRCPRCNRYGTNDLDGYCKDCYNKPYEKPTKRDLLMIQNRTNKRIVSGALAEIKKDSLKYLTDEEINRVYNIVMRRLPVKRTGHLVRGANPMEGYGYSFTSEPKEHGLIKERCGYEHSDME